MVTILWIIAVILVIVGIVQLVQGQLGLGIVLIVVGLLIGPGGVSIFATSSLMGASGVFVTWRPRSRRWPTVLPPRSRTGPPS
ncbi:MAG TPA: GPGG-motif small membrane protein [Acidimicrobiales bacterium]|jgi:hypothetical protein